MTGAASMVWDEGYLGYDLGADHPLNPVRLALTVALTRMLGVLDADHLDVVPARPATDDVLALVHDPAYIDAVRRTSADPYFEGFGLGTPDNPVFPGMHDAAALIAGGSVGAADLVWSGRALHAANIGGGLHHAMRSQASGFCVYNDAAIAIAWLLAHGAERIAYVDIDVHHGDGVQDAFYDDPRVLTISLHQSPLSLFPGTGFPTELGGANAHGTAVNVALPPGTDDAGWLGAFSAVVPSLLRVFRPQLLVTQCGCDTHREDPLADLALTVDGQRASYEALHGLAHELCDGRWLALGGGGYGLVRCVPRAWAHLLAEVAGRPIAPETPVPAAFAEQARARGLRTPPPLAMSDLEDPSARPWPAPWVPAGDSPLDRAITATRRATFPLHGLDPEDPRD